MVRPAKPGAESIFNFILLLLALLIIYESIQMGFGTLKRPGSGLFPLFCGAIIMGLNGFLLLRRADSTIASLFQEGQRWKFFTMIIPFFAWILLIHLLGYVVVTFLCTLYLAKTLKLSGWWQPLHLSACTASICFVVFDYLLILDLPRGFWR